MATHTASIAQVLAIANRLALANIPFEIVSSGQEGKITCKFDETLSLAVDQYRQSQDQLNTLMTLREASREKRSQPTRPFCSTCGGSMKVRHPVSNYLCDCPDCCSEEG